MNLKRKQTAILQILTGFLIYHIFLSPVSAQVTSSWNMAGGNPQRTSYVTSDSSNQTEIKSGLSVEWYAPIDPYIPTKFQLVVSNDMVFVSTAKGLVAYDLSGNQKWIYPTELPLGNSPTIVNSVAYVGGMDSKLYAINVTNGQLLWSFYATGDEGIGGGFDTNPLVLNNVIYLGNRNGYFYAIDAVTHNEKWKYKTEGPIHFSAAASVDGSKIYFASDDTRAYALNASNGTLIWKSAKLPSEGFHAWWPVVAGDKVIFSASRPYRFNIGPQTGNTAFWGGDPPMIDFTPWPIIYSAFTKQNSDGTWDATNVLSFYQTHPYVRNHYVLNASDGIETTIAPFTRVGTSSGNNFPVGATPDGTIFAIAHRSADKYNQGLVSWKLGTNYVNASTPGFTAYDEPAGFSMGGNVAYWVQCCDRAGGAFDINTKQGWSYYSYNLQNLAPGYNENYTGDFESNAVMVFGDRNGVYGGHGYQSPPIPYKGKVFMVRGNALMAFSSTNSKRKLAEVTINPQSVNKAASVDTLKTRLDSEVLKIINAGHLRPGIGMEGVFAFHSSGLNGDKAGDAFSDYFNSPADIFLTLSKAYPYLSSMTQSKVKTYLASEYTNYSPCKYNHVGWGGADREYFDLPPEIRSAVGGGPFTTNTFSGWGNYGFHPHSFYALWLYAKNVDPSKASAIFSDCKSKLQTPVDDATFTKYPFALNSWISGYIGYVELAKMTGNTSDANAKQQTVDSLVQKRINNFDENGTWVPNDHNYNQAFSVARNFYYLTPELASKLKSNSTVFPKIQTAYSHYVHNAPYWFVTRFEETPMENINHHLYDYISLFSAKAYLFNAPREELVKYLDVPAFKVGDLFYIQNLVATLEAPSDGSVPTPTTPVATSTPGTGCSLKSQGDADCNGVVNLVDFEIWRKEFTGSLLTKTADFNTTGTVDIVDFEIWRKKLMNG